MTRRAAVEADGSPYAWARLAVSLTLMTISGCSMYAVVVVLPAVQSEFGVARADASLPYSMTMIGFGLGGLFMGRLADRFGVMVPVLIGGVSLGAGFVLAGNAGSIWTFSARARLADRRARQLGDVRAAHRRHVALVHEEARYRGRDLRERKLRRGRDLAASREPLRGGLRLAWNLPGDRRVLRDRA